MRIDVSGLTQCVTANKGMIAEKEQACFDHMCNIETVIYNPLNCNSKAYQSCYSYLAEVKLPVLRRHLLFMGTLTQDIQSDLGALSSLSRHGLSVIDTDAINAQIQQIDNEIDNLYDWLFNYGSLLPGSRGRITQLIVSDRERVRQLKEICCDAFDYAYNNSLYAASNTEAGALVRATQVLREVYFDAASGAFCPVPFSDWSWLVDETDPRYWETYNRQTLNRFFVFNENGDLVEFTPAMLALLKRFAPNLFDGNADISALEGTLSPQEKYALLYFVTMTGEAAYGIGEKIVWNMNDVWSVIGGAGKTVEETFLPPFLRGPLHSLTDIVAASAAMIVGNVLATMFPNVDFSTFELPFVTDNFAFMWRDGHWTTSDKPGTLQSRSGFSDFYDPAVGLLGMNIDTETVVFQSGGKEYRLQLWDGRYGWGSLAGGEIGIYYRDVDEAKDRPYIPKNFSTLHDDIRFMTPNEVDNYFINYRCMPEGEQFPMQLTIYDQNDVRVVYNDTRGYAANGDHYWDLSTVDNMDKWYGKDDLYMEVKIAVTDPTLRDDMRDAFESQGIAVSQNDSTLTVIWGKQ